MKKIALAALLAVSFAAQANVVTFDDIAGNGSAVVSGYNGVNWNNFYVLDGVADTNSGYQNGVVSANNVAYNAYANPASISAASNAGFSLSDGFFTAAWNNGLTVTASAVFENATTATKSFTLDTTGPIDEFFGWNDLASVTFSSAGGTSAGLKGAGAHFALDNLNLAQTAAVPEPGTDALLMLGLVAVGVSLRRRKSA
jgi:hypothetical protein